jgi:hypothetical protein
LLDVGLSVGVFAFFKKIISILDKLRVSYDIFFSFYLLHEFLSLGEPSLFQQKRKLVEMNDIPLPFGHFKLTLEAFIKHPQDLVSVLDSLPLSKEDLVIMNNSSYVLVGYSAKHRIIGVVDSLFNVFVDAPFNEISK